VRSGKRIRAHAVLASTKKKPDGRVMLTVSCTVEIEGEEKPAVVADLLSLMLPARAEPARGTAPIRDGTTMLELQSGRRVSARPRR
jgi:hypothetical protein